MYHFCTIITANYFPYARALYTSLKAVNERVTLSVLICGAVSTNEIADNGLEVFYEDAVIKKSTFGKKLKEKYADSDIHAFRWSLKPVFLKFLIEERELDKVIYVDADIFFYSDFQFLFEKLTVNNVLLTPHWRSSNPLEDEKNFRHLFTEGLYNAGFFGINKKAIHVLDWWASASLAICENEKANGQFFDQTHLNLMPVYFEGVEVLKHRGCNVANWNQLECKRVLTADNNVLINGIYEIVFIHFTRSTIRGVLNKKDGLLQSHLDEYVRTLRQFGVDILTDISVPQKKPESMFRKFLNKVRFI